MKRILFLPLILVIIACLNVSCGEDEVTYPCVDKMGNSYKTVVIGDQVWMAENLANKRLSDIEVLQNTYDTRQYNNRDIPQYSYFNDNSSYYEYGFLYNHRAAKDVRLIPDGWRLPTKADWEKLETYIKEHPSYDSINWVGKTLAAKDNWQQSSLLGAIGNQRTTNDKYGFTIIPAGYRTELGAFYYEGKRTCFWTSTKDTITTNFQLAMFEYSEVGIQWITLDSVKSGAYIRCVRDL